MVLIGTRVDSKLSCRFLLQNWWEMKQFVEVDVDYLKKCGATLYFVNTAQTHVLHTFHEK